MTHPASRASPRCWRPGGAALPGLTGLRARLRRPAAARQERLRRHLPRHRHLRPRRSTSPRGPRSSSTAYSRSGAGGHRQGLHGPGRHGRQGRDASCARAPPRGCATTRPLGELFVQLRRRSAARSLEDGDRLGDDATSTAPTVEDTLGLGLPADQRRWARPAADHHRGAQHRARRSRARGAARPVEDQPLPRPGQPEHRRHRPGAAGAGPHGPGARRPRGHHRPGAARGRPISQGRCATTPTSWSPSSWRSTRCRPPRSAWSGATRRDLVQILRRGRADHGRRSSRSSPSSSRACSSLIRGLGVPRRDRRGRLDPASTRSSRWTRPSSLPVAAAVAVATATPTAAGAGGAAPAACPAADDLPGGGGGRPRRRARAQLAMVGGGRLMSASSS